MIIGIFLKHIKAYKNINFIPIGFEHNFVGYAGENGSGKSSILEGLNSFFNNQKYSINKNALEDGIKTIGNEPFFVPIFMIDKNKVKRNKKEFEKISSYFWSIKKNDLSSGVQGSTKDFFDLRDKLIQTEKFDLSTHYLLVVGEYKLDQSPKINFCSFHNEENFLIYFLNKNKSDISTSNRKEIISEWKDLLVKTLDQKDWKDFLIELKDLYSYVYLPVELEVESFTKIETNEMQKIFDKKLKDEIESALANINLDKSDGINKKLELFIRNIETVLNHAYTYKTGKERNNNITKSDLVNKIIEAYFQKRTLHKIEGKIEKKVTELSAGEKRQALIELVYAFLKDNIERKNMIIIGIDEPENSLHNTLCYSQFEKLKEVSKNNQLMFTTHWYGFLPIISEGLCHFLTQKDKIFFESYDLYDYKAKAKKSKEESKGVLPYNFFLKSTNDLVQSIYYSLSGDNPYNWLIVEGISEKIYFEFFFEDLIKDKKLRILALGGQSKVSELYEYLELPIKNKENNIKGKIWCLIDTDQKIHKAHIGVGYDNLKIRRLSNKNTNNKTALLTLNNPDSSITDIEQSLNPIIFTKTVKELDDSEKFEELTCQEEKGNTDFIKNFRNLDLEEYFKENNGQNKITFAKEYIHFLSKEADPSDLTPLWIKEIKDFF